MRLYQFLKVEKDFFLMLCEIFCIEKGWIVSAWLCIYDVPLIHQDTPIILRIRSHLLNPKWNCATITMLAAIFLCEIAAIGFVISESNSSLAIQNKIIGKRLPSNWPRVEKNIGFQMCLRKCEAMSYCLSINFNRVLFECELNDQRKNDTNDLVDDDNYFYAKIIVSSMN